MPNNNKKTKIHWFWITQCQT